MNIGKGTDSKFTSLFFRGISLKKDIETGDSFREYSLHKAKVDILKSATGDHQDEAKKSSEIEKAVEEQKQPIQKEADGYKINEAEAKKKEADQVSVQKYKDEISKLKKEVDQAHQDLQTKIEESKNKELHIEDLTTLKKAYFASIESCYNTVKGTTSKFDKNFELKLSLDNAKNYELLERMHYIKLPNLKKIMIDYLPNDNAVIYDFFDKAFPNEIESLCLNCKSSVSLDLRHYLDAILPHIHKVSKEIYFKYF